jgi:hypothetical protein
MSKLASALQISPLDLFTTSTTKTADLGALAMTADGRKFRYCLAGGTALVAGKLQQASAEVTANQDLTAVAAAVGDLAIAASSTVTVTANQYAEGWALITVTPGLGQMYQISGHAAFTAAAPTFTLSDPIRVALTTSSRIDLVANPYSAVIVNPATASSVPVGVAVANNALSTYGWIQTGGIANVLADGALTVGVNLSASNAVAGAVEAAVTAQAAVGVAVTGIADTQYGAVYLKLD